MKPERTRAACAVIRAAMSSRGTQRWLREGFEQQAIADAFAIGQAEDLVVGALEDRTPNELGAAIERIEQWIVELRRTGSVGDFIAQEAENRLKGAKS